MDFLISMGFDYESAKDAFRIANGDIDTAVQILLAGPSNTIPSNAGDSVINDDSSYINDDNDLIVHDDDNHIDELPWDNDDSDIPSIPGYIPSDVSNPSSKGDIAAKDNRFVSHSSEGIMAYDAGSAPNASEKQVQLSVSQYDFDAPGSSACTSIACAMGMKLLQMLDDGMTPLETLDDPVKLCEEFFTGMYFHTTVCNNSPYGPQSHLTVDEIYYKIPEIQEIVHMVSDYPIQSVYSRQNDHFLEFITTIRRLGNERKYTALILVKPPETICIVLPPAAEEDKGYILFDSHSRPQLGLENSYIVYIPAKASVAERLHTLFPPLPLDDLGGFQNDDYMTSMYEQFEGTPFQLKV